MALDKYIPDIEELVAGFEKAGFAKEASELKTALHGLPAGGRLNLQTRPRQPRWTPKSEPQEVAPTDKTIPFAEVGEEVTELTPYGDVAGRAGIPRPSFNKNMTQREYDSVQDYIERQVERGWDEVDHIRQKIIDEKANINKGYPSVEELSYLNKKLIEARQRVESLKKPVETFKRIRNTIGVDMPNDISRGDILNKLRAEYTNANTSNERRTLLNQFFKLGEMLNSTSIGMLDADQINRVYAEAMNPQSTPEVFNKQMAQLKHTHSFRAAAQKIALIACRLQKIGMTKEASSLNVAFQRLIIEADKNLYQG